MDGDMRAVYERLGIRAAKFLDEQHRELPLPENHWGKEPLFMAPPERRF